MENNNTQIVNVSNNNTSIFPKAIVEAKMSVTPNQMDVLAILLAEIGKDTDVAKNLEYTLTAKDYAKLKGYDNIKKAYEVLKTKVCGTTKNDSMRHIGFDMWMGEDKFVQYNWFSQIIYENGMATFTLTPQIKQFLVEFKENDSFKVFTKLQYILPMRSQYSKRIYLMCREYILTGNRFCDTDWNLFLEKLNVPSTYSFAQVKERVLDKAMEDINNFSDINITYDVHMEKGKGRTGSTPASISFTIKLKTKNIEKAEDWV